MKLNWGTSIVLVLVGFISFISYFFIRGMYIPQDELVNEEYYEEGLRHDEKQVWRKNAKALSADLTFSKSANGDIEIVLPPELKLEKLKVEILFLRPNNMRLDIEVTENQDGRIDPILADKFVGGNYRVSTKIITNGTIYFWESNFSY